MKQFLNNNICEKYLWLLIWFLLPISIRFSSMALVFLSLTIIIKYSIKPIPLNKNQIITTSLFIVFFLFFLINLLPDYNNFSSLWNELQKKLALVFVPLMYLLSKLPSTEIRKFSTRGLFAGMFLSGLVLGIRFLYLAPSEKLENIVYHNFTKPLELGAIYYSLYLFAIIFILLDERTEPALKKYRIYLIPFFFFLMMLAASKLFIITTFPFIIWQLIKIKKLEKKKKILVLISTGLIFLILIYPISQRFSDLKNTNLELVHQSSYKTDTQFNGLSLRLIQWKFAFEILNENNAWFFGTGTKNKQNLLNDKYIESGMYIGNSETEDQGYLGYNFHNQYIETLAGLGIFGLIIMIFIMFKGFVSNQFFSLPLYFILILFFITESVLERQVGIVFFCLIFSSFINEFSEPKRQ